MQYLVSIDTSFIMNTHIQFFVFLPKNRLTFFTDLLYLAMHTLTYTHHLCFLSPGFWQKWFLLSELLILHASHPGEQPAITMATHTPEINKAIRQQTLIQSNLSSCSNIVILPTLPLLKPCIQSLLGGDQIIPA